MKYYNTYFRVNTKGYNFNNGWTEEDHKAFNDEITELFTQNGWIFKEEAYNCHCAKLQKGNQSLYMHPQSFSGTVEENEIKSIENFTKEAKTFEIYHIDTYEEIHDMGDQEYREYLDAKKDDVEIKLLQALRTKRTNLFITGMYDVRNHVLSGIKLKRLCDKSTMGNKTESEFIQEILNKLVLKGWVLEHEFSYGNGYRTLNKTEQKKLKVDFGF